MEKAAAILAGKVNVEVRWFPFFLDATMPAEPRDKLQHYHHKFGKARVDQMIPHMKVVGLAEGINFS